MLTRHVANSYCMKYKFGVSSWRMAFIIAAYAPSLI